MMTTPLTTPTHVYSDQNGGYNSQRCKTVQFKRREIHARSKVENSQAICMSVCLAAVDIREEETISSEQ